MDGIGISGNVSLDMSVLNPVGVSIAGVSKYDELKDKPKINGVEVSGSKSLDDYGIASKADVESKLTWNVLKGTANGAVVHVDDAFPSSLLGIDIEGASEQWISTGKNLAKLTEAQKTSNGVNIDIKANGQIILDGTCSANGLWLKIGTVDVVEGKTYCLSINKAYQTLGVSAWSNSENRHVIFAPARIQAAKGTATKTETLYIFAVGGTNTTFTNEVVSIQVEEGSSATSWEPYTDGKPSPSPEYPQEIRVIENPVVKVTGADTSAVSTSLPFTLPAEHPYLAKLPGGTADEIVVDSDGNVELVARVGMNRDVRKVVDFQQGQYYELEVGLKPFASQNEDYNKPVLCSALPSKETTPNNEGIYRTWNGVYVRDTSGRTKEEIQAEVDRNAPLTVAGVIPETRYQLGKIEMPKAQDSIVNVWTDAEVTPSTGIEYVRDVNIVVSNLESAIASITQG